MTVDPVIVAGALALLSAMGGLLVLQYRAFMSGDLHPKATVPRESFERLVSINESYAEKFDEQTKAVRTLAEGVAKLAARLEAASRRKP